MSINLKKGGNVNLTKTDPGMTKILLGLGWDPRTTTGKDFDLDAHAWMLGANEKCRGEADFIYFNNLKSPEGSVEHTGDNRTGAGDGDDEVIKVDLSKVPADVQKIVFTVSIYEAAERGQNFGQVKSAFIRLVNADDNTEKARYDLSEDASVETAMMFAELYRNNGEWKFRAVGQGFPGGLEALVRNFGL